MLSPDEWVVAWDHVLSSSPSFLLCVTAAVSLALQPTVMTSTAQQVQVSNGCRQPRLAVDRPDGRLQSGVGQ